MSTLATVQEMLIDEFGLAAGQVAADAKLGDLGIDSLATLEFLFRLEERFKLELAFQPDAVATVADIAGELDRQLAAA
jgi:acyl carrier protein